VGDRHSAALGADHAGSLFQYAQAAGGDNYFGALLGEKQRGAATQVLASADHQDDFVI
jgi:hypothetical protein